VLPPDGSRHMPLYYFHVRDGVDITDDTGTECADLPAARSKAIRASGTMIQELGAKFWSDPEDWQMNVTDAVGTAQFTVLFASR
jgi:hypothetical protein